jgi:hypothetical protein
VLRHAADVVLEHVEVDDDGGSVQIFDREHARSLQPPMP